MACTHLLQVSQIGWHRAKLLRQRATPRCVILHPRILTLQNIAQACLGGDCVQLAQQHLLVVKLDKLVKNDALQAAKRWAPGLVGEDGAG